MEPLETHPGLGAWPSPRCLICHLHTLTRDPTTTISALLQASAVPLRNRKTMKASLPRKLSVCSHSPLDKIQPLSLTGKQAHWEGKKKSLTQPHSRKTNTSTQTLTKDRNICLQSFAVARMLGKLCSVELGSPTVQVRVAMRSTSC